jgi:hypothetical protein
MRNVRAMKSTIIIFGGLLLAGCTSTYAVYKHPVTEDVLECEETPKGGGLLDLVGTHYYAKCKTTLEQQGYVRSGTVKRAPTATSAPDAATPRPAPR